MADEKSLTKQVNEIMESNDATLALDLIKKLEPIIATTGDKQKEVILNLIAKLRVVALKFMKDSTTMALFENNPLQIVSLPASIDVISNLRFRLGENIYVEERNEMRDKWKAALARSEQTLGREKIILGSKIVKPSVGNWIRLYNSAIETPRATSVQIARFFSQNHNLQQLDEKNKNALKKIFNIFEFLKTRSEELAGFEDSEVFSDENGVIFIVEEGAVRPLYRDSDLVEAEEKAKRGELRLSELVDLKMKYPKRFDKYKMPASTVASSVDQSQTDQSMVADFFAKQKDLYTKSIQAPRTPDSTEQRFISFQQNLGQVSERSILSSKSILSEVVKNKGELIDFMQKKDITKMIIDEFPVSMGEENKKSIQRGVLSPLGFQALLRIVFEDKFKLTEEEALWHSFEILQKFPFELKDYKTLVTYELGENKLVWRY